MALLVQKFGGTSVADPDRIKAVADQVARCRRRGDSVALVISAMGKETDELLYMASQVADSKPGREMDMLITAGERKATALVCMALIDLGVPAESFTGSQAGFVTTGAHQNAKIIDINPYRISDALEQGIVPVLAGSQGVSEEKNVTFLGRGGSDTTAVALANALQADSCELYTDVSGVFTADPRIVLNAQKMEAISFNELLEMTASGCPKPALRSVEFAHANNVPLHIRSAFTWETGTLVVEEESTMEQPNIRAVTHDIDTAKFTVTGIKDIPGQSAKLFRSLVDSGVNVDMIVQNSSTDGEAHVSFTTPVNEINKVKACLSGGLLDELEASGLVVNDVIGKVSIVGAGMKSDPGTAAKVFETLAEHGINIHMISTSPIRISCLVDSEKVEQAVVKLHTAFGLDK